MRTLAKRRAWSENLRTVVLLLRVVAVVASLRLLVSIVTLRRILDWLTPHSHYFVADERSFPKVVRYTDALVRRLPSWAGSRCLLRSLALYYFATRYGFAVKLHCGIRRAGDALEGHAWLSLHGKAFYEKGLPDLTYAITFTFPPAQTA